MTIHSLISQATPPLEPDDTVEHALGLMMEIRVRHLPVVSHDGYLLGILSEDQLLDASGPDAQVEGLIGPSPISVMPHTHVFDVTKLIVRHDLTTVPVAEEDNKYVGLVRRHDIFEQFARMLSTQEAGAILAIEVEAHDYSLAQLVYTVESNNVKILSIATEMPETEYGKIRITLKLNVTDTARIRHMLEHHGYHTVAAFSDDRDADDLQFRVEEFMRYLEV
jgi:predicted transcriptional regulator